MDLRGNAIVTVIVLASETELRRLRPMIGPGRAEISSGREFFFGTMHGRDVCLVKTGVGRRNAAAAARRICSDLRPGAVIIAGAAGALDPGLQPGTVVVVDTVLREDGPERISCPAEWFSRALDTLRASGLRPQAGWCCQARTFVYRAADKQALHAKTGARAVDMESFAFAAEFQRAGVPFVDIRVVSDSAQHDTADMETLVRLRFRRGRPAAALHLARHPRELARAYVLYRGMAVAGRAIAGAVRILMASGEFVRGIPETAAEQGAAFTTTFVK